MTQLSVVDLFCGVGGFSLGAHFAGFEAKLAIDNDPIALNAFKRNFPKTNCLIADLANEPPSGFSSGLAHRRLDLIIGGPPCQGFSSMGRRDPKDPRRTLLVRYFEWVSSLLPRVFVMENVPGLLFGSNRELLDRAVSQLPSHYKVLNPIVLDASQFGAPTKRPRVVVVGFDEQVVDSLTTSELSQGWRGRLPTVGDALLDLPDIMQTGDDWQPYSKRQYISSYAKRCREAPQTGVGDPRAFEFLKNGVVSGNTPTKHSSEVTQRFASLVPGLTDSVSKYPRLSWDKPAGVLRAGTGSDRGSYQAARPIHPKADRVITVREAARIQGFPDWFQFHRTKWHSHRMIGNSVSPIFAGALLRRIATRLGM